MTHPCAYFLFLATIVLKLAPEPRMLQVGEDEDTPWPPNVHSTRLQLGPLGVILRSRMAFALLANVIAFIEPWAALPVLLLASG
ncbi:MAG: hypothetical protein V4819_18010 [Verrucomicrobiota bacterium]